jgi:hypothetical protein
LGNTALKPKIATLGRFFPPCPPQFRRKVETPVCGWTFDSKTYCMAHAFLSTSSRTHLGMDFDANQLSNIKRQLLPSPQYSISTAFLQRESFSFISSQRELTSFAFFEMGPRSVGLDVPIPPNFTSNNMRQFV